MSCPDTFAGRSLGLVVLSLAGWATAGASGCGSSPPPDPPSPALLATTPAPPPAPPASETPEPPGVPGPVVIARGLGVVDDLVASETFLYVVKKKSVVTRIPLAGGPAEDIATFENQAIIESVAPSAEGLYVLITAVGAEATKQGYAGQGSLFLIPAKGGDAQSLAQGFRKPSGLVVDDAQLHWSALKDAGKKPSWFLFSAPRKIAAPALTSTALADRADRTDRTDRHKRGAADAASGDGSARLLGEYKGAAVVASPSGALSVQPFGRGAGRAMKGLAGYVFARPSAAISGDRLAVGGSATHDGKALSVVGLASLAAPDEELVPLAVLDGAVTVGDVAFAGDDVVYTVVGTREKHDKDGSVVRVSAADKKATILASDQFQPTRILVTSRGIVWLDKGATDTDDPDGALVLLPK